MKHKLDNDIDLVPTDNWTPFEHELASTLAVRAKDAASPAVSADVPTDAQPLAEQRHHLPRFARAALVAVAAAVIAIAAIGIFQLSESVDESETVVATSPAAAEPPLTQDQPTTHKVGPPTGEAFDHIAETASTASYERPYRSIEEAIASVAARDEFPQFGAVAVVGSVTSVQPGFGFSWTGNERTILPYGDLGSLVNSVHLTVEVAETLVAPQVDAQPTQVTVGLAIGPNFSIDKVRADYLSLDRVVLILVKSPVFDYEPDLFGILEDGRIMGVIDENDNVTFPLLERGDRLVPEGGIALDRLRTAAEPKVTQDQPTAAEVGPPTGEAFDYIAAWAAMPSRTARPFQSAEEIIPFVVSAGDEFPQFGFVAVIGTVTAVEPGRSVNGGGKSVRLTVNVVETLAPQPNDQPTQMTVGQVIGPLSIDTVRADYLSLDRVLLVLFKSPVFDYDPDLFGILEDGRIMGVIDENDNVTFPLLPRGDQLAPEGGIALDRLRAPDPN